MNNELDINLDQLIDRLKDDGNTHQEALALIFTATGEQAEETAEEMFISANTARMHIRNSKATTGYNKASEISGYVICKALGIDYDKLANKLKELARKEVKDRVLSGTRRVLSVCLSLVVSYSLLGQSLHQEYCRTNRRRVVRTELSNRRKETLIWKTL